MLTPATRADAARKIRVAFAWLLAQALIPGFLLPATVRGGEADASLPPLKNRVRQPTALAMTSADGLERLLVANRRSGSVTLIDPAARRVVAEQDLGLELADLAALPDGRHFLAVDRAASDLLLVQLRSDRMSILARLRLSPDPVRVSIARDERECVVASLWSRRLTLLNLVGPRDRGDLSPRIVSTLELPLSPRELARSVDDSTLVVGDAFGGKLAVVNLKTRSLQRMLTFPGHNIRALATGPGGKTLLVAHQLLSPLARSAFDDVHWGTLLGNQLQSLPWTAVLHGSTELVKGSRAVELGDVGRGAGDPSGLLIDRRGRVAIALGGVDEVECLDGPGDRPRRIGVGRRPVALASSRDGKELYVADSFDDTISVVEPDSGRRVAVIPLGPRPELSLIERGERLFYDARLSHDGWMSCQSCHSDGHTSGLNADTLGDGSYGAPKKIPSLLGVGSTGPWNWTGSIARLEDQVSKSITTTMQGPRTMGLDADVAALTAYLRSLKPISISAAIVGESPSEDSLVSRGREVFASQLCARCHAAPEFTSPSLFDVRLADEVGNRLFNPPSLRGVRFRELLLHDGRARTLEDVFSRHKHPGSVTVPAEAIPSLIAYLKTL